MKYDWNVGYHIFWRDCVEMVINSNTFIGRGSKRYKLYEEQLLLEPLSGLRDR